MDLIIYDNLIFDGLVTAAKIGFLDQLLDFMDLMVLLLKREENEPTQNVNY